MRAGLLLLALAAAPSMARAQEAPRVEVPIRQTVLPDGTPRYSITLGVGTGSVEAMLDSGSTGLRLLPTAVPLSNLTSTGTPNKYGYGSGAVFTGVIATAKLSIGSLEGKRPVRLQAIQSAGCNDAKPNCPVARVDAKDYRIGGNGRMGDGFQAILGTNMGDDEAENPFVAMGVNRWIIDLPKPGDKKPGRLVLNPSAQDAAGFTLFPIDPRFGGQRGGHHDAISACLTNGKTKAEVCAPTLLDSGATAVVIMVGRMAEPVNWKSRIPATLSFKPPQGDALSISFVTDRDKPSTLRVNPPAAAPRTRIVAGSLPYYSFSVLYDAQSGTVGLKPR